LAGLVQVEGKVFTKDLLTVDRCELKRRSGCFGRALTDGPGEDQRVLDTPADDFSVPEKAPILQGLSD
jgi:hypothetical protein